MKIIKKGVVRNNLLTHTCERCGCEIEVYETMNTPTVYYNHRSGYHISLRCPMNNCGQMMNIKTDKHYYNR